LVFGFLILELMPLLVLFGDSAMISLDKPIFKSAETFILLSRVFETGGNFLFFSSTSEGNSGSGCLILEWALF